MLKLTEDNRDKIVAFLAEVNVPVKASPNFLAIIDVLSKLEKFEEPAPSKEAANG